MVTQNGNTSITAPQAASVLAATGLDASEIQLLKDTVAKGATDAELGFFLRFCASKKLDPFAKQVHLVKRWDTDLGREVMSIQMGIDGYRVLSQRTDELQYQRGPEWCGVDGIWTDVWLDEKNPPKAARFTVKVKRQEIAITAVALFREYAQKKKDGTLNRMWATMSVGQIAKCAEALCLRRAFPEDLGEVRTHEEMARADNPDDEKIDVPPKVVTSRAAALKEKLADAKGQPAAAAAPLALEAPATPTVAEVLAPVVDVIPAAVATAAPSPAAPVPVRVEVPAVDPVTPFDEPSPSEREPPATPPPAPAAVAAAPVVEGVRMANEQQHKTIVDMMDRLMIPPTSALRISVIRSASKVPTAAKVSDLTFQQADEAILALRTEVQKKAAKVGT